jgi:hypothetical protein
MIVNLPDVNFLIALSWRTHVHHHAAREWFTAHRNQSFATCPITESGFVRLSMNPHVVGEAVTFEEALSALEVYLNHPNHTFWAADADFVAMVRDLPIIGYRQTTDAYLLGLAVRNGGRLITFDKKIGELAEGREDVSKHLVCVEAVF